MQGSCSTEVEITFEPRSVCIESSSEETYQRDGDIYLHSGNVPNIADTWKMGSHPPDWGVDVWILFEDGDIPASYVIVDP